MAQDILWESSIKRFMGTRIEREGNIHFCMTGNLLFDNPIHTEKPVKSFGIVSQTGLVTTFH